MFDEQKKIGGLIVHLIRDSKLVLIHSSLSSMGFVQGGAESVVEALKSLSKRGITVMMFALSYRSVTRLSPIFDHEKAPSNVDDLGGFRKKSRSREKRSSYAFCLRYWPSGR